ncbi:hypothetical protein D3C86_1267930 [compost metagenome]
MRIFVFFNSHICILQKSVQIADAHTGIDYRTIRFQVQAGWVATHIILLCDLYALSFFSIYFIIDESCVVFISGFFGRKKFFGHFLAGTTPGGVYIYKDNLIFFLSFSQSFCKSTFFKFDTLCPEHKRAGRCQKQAEYGFSHVIQYCIMIVVYTQYYGI